MHLADLTTFRVGGPVAGYVRAQSRTELLEALTQSELPILLLGGGSNILAADAGFAGLVICDGRQEITVVDTDNHDGILLRASAGVIWDDLVQYALDHQWAGLEALSGIPGTVGAAPVQNIGAYGAEVAQVLHSVRAWDRLTGKERQLFRADLQLEYRNSVLKRSLTDPQIGGGRLWGPTGRWIVLEVEFSLQPSHLSVPVCYQQLAGALDVNLGEQVEIARVRQAVLDLRRSKGMVVDETDRDTWSAGSFFVNPILDEAAAALLPAEAPRYPVSNSEQAGSKATATSANTGEKRVKTSAAWLIAHAGFAKGYKVRPDAPAGLSTKHVLALTNRGGARASDIVELAQTIQQKVFARFGIQLEPEPVYVGF